MEEGSRNEAGGRNEDEDPGGHPTGGAATVNEGGGGDLRVTVSLTTHQQQDVTMEGKGILNTPGRPTRGGTPRESLMEEVKGVMPAKEEDSTGPTSCNQVPGHTRQVSEWTSRHPQT